VASKEFRKGGRNISRIAIVIDASGSMDHIRIFAISTETVELYPDDKARLWAGADINQLTKLVDEYDKVYFFTDGCFFGSPDMRLVMQRLSNKIEIIKI